MNRDSTKSPAGYLVCGATLLVALLWTTQSWLRWAHFSYTTFDLAFYVQALDGFCHGRNWSSLLGVKPFGNHADFVILFIWPIYAIFRHPMVLVVVQNLALASCLPLGWKIATKMGWSRRPAFALAAILLVNPILTFVAIHEFHPEAFAAPLWLALYYAWRERKLWLFWGCLIVFLSCKENLGFMVIAWCFAKMLDRSDRRNFWKWIVFPALFTMGWMALYFFWLGPKWNQGNVDFSALYSHLHEQGLVQGAISNLRNSLRGNLLWVLLLPMLLIPLRRPLSLLPAVPILLQHLLSWRSSEWGIYFHYAAPLLPVFWIATLESLASKRSNSSGRQMILPAGLVLANMICFFWVGTPSRFMEPWFTYDSRLTARRDLVGKIPPEASVLAPLPYQSHLAARQELYSLHLLLKGLKTLSRKSYVPPPATDYVIVDYDDPITFDPFSGYYHPAMQTKTGEVVPSSDILLHRFLAGNSWKVSARDALTVCEKEKNFSDVRIAAGNSAIPLKSGLIDPMTDLLTIRAVMVEGGWKVESDWFYRAVRTKIPWMRLVATNRVSGKRQSFTRGLCCPEGVSDGKVWRDSWLITRDAADRPAEWELRAVFEDHGAHTYAGRESPLSELFVANIPWADP